MSHCPANCNPARKSCSHSFNGRAHDKARRCASTRTASCWVTANASCGWVGNSRQARTPALRSSISAAMTAAPSKAGACFNQSSTASVEASQGMARSKHIRLAAARVVESFQPVSSRMAMPRSPSMAPTRRVSKRSCAISATGLRPCTRWANTQAAACSASSSKSSAARRDGK